MTAKERRHVGDGTCCRALALLSLDLLDSLRIRKLGGEDYGEPLVYTEFA